ncbi:MAG: hypothetical protein E6H01_13230 [Bacillati bacterium ANGP1]|uniref:Uncharacterized protein n=1 Tax=Candidatus Segetimicrobium genomatis TaxID=2569760 RepID=A0A537KNP9_9BACT|nr:MAG: hypothetical protein E6H01_13230 [Terrabacteria group bacterium ANGP1]
MMRGQPGAMSGESEASAKESIQKSASSAKLVYMAKPRPEKKREPAEPTAKVLPMELQVGDRLADETGEWEVIAPPYSTAGGRVAHARVQRIDEPASWEIRSWDVSKRISVKRVG